MTQHRQLSIKQILALHAKIGVRPLTRQESGRLAAYRNNRRPLAMTEARLEARRKGGQARAVGQRADSAVLRLSQAEAIDTARARLWRSLGRKPTYAEIAVETGLGVRTVRRVRAWQKKG